MSRIEETLKNLEDSWGSVTPYEISKGLVFRPLNENIKNAERVQYLAKPVVVASSNKKDGFVGFSGRLHKVIRRVCL
jgi:hypothetical protein